MRMKTGQVLESTLQHIVAYFEGKMGNVISMNKMDNNTSIISFKDNILIVSMDMIERIIEMGRFSLFTLSLNIIINGKVILQKHFEGDGYIVLTLSKNIKYNLDALLEGKDDECIRASTQEEVTV